jgi:acyl-CoA thioesterase-1
MPLLILRRLFLFVCLVCFVGTSARAASAPRTIVFFGDSLTAGYGLDNPAEDAFPALIEKKIAAEKRDWRVVNAGLSGETTAAGLRRVDWILRQPIDIFVLALGGNDGLRGISPTVSSANLQGIIDRVRAKYPAAKIVLAGMMMPPSMGEEYTRAFADMYPALAKKNGLTFIPFLLDAVGGIAELNQADRIHPVKKGHEIVANTVWKYLRPLL